MKSISSCRTCRGAPHSSWSCARVRSRFIILISSAVIVRRLSPSSLVSSCASSQKTANRTSERSSPSASSGYWPLALTSLSHAETMDRQRRLLGSPPPAEYHRILQLPEVRVLLLSGVLRADLPHQELSALEIPGRLGPLQEDLDGDAVDQEAVVLASGLRLKRLQQRQILVPLRDVARPDPPQFLHEVRALDLTSVGTCPTDETGCDQSQHHHENGSRSHSPAFSISSMSERISEAAQDDMPSLAGRKGLDGPPGRPRGRPARAY